jgi:hypothetical protein
MCQEAPVNDEGVLYMADFLFRAVEHVEIYLHFIHRSFFSQWLDSPLGA